MGKSRTKSYRKTNIDDVEEALEDDRLIGKIQRKSARGKGDSKEGKDKDPAAGLFTVDTKGSFEGISKKTKRELARAKLFPAKAPNIGLSAAEEFNIARAERGMADKAKAASKTSEEPDLFDLWSAPMPNHEARLQVEGIKSGVSMASRVNSKVPAYQPKTLHQKVSTAPAVLTAHEGQSVNPEPIAFADLACTAAAKQLEVEREAEAVERQQAPITSELTDRFGAEAVKEMSEEAKINAYRAIVMPDRVEGEQDDTTAEDALRRSSKRKASSTRNREYKRKIIDHLDNQKKKQKVLEKSVGEVGTILKEMKEREKFLEKRKEYRKELKHKRKRDETITGAIPKSRRVGKTKFMEEALLIPDAEASARGLRAMPLGGRTAVKERVGSIMRRGLLPAPPEATRGYAHHLKEKRHSLQKGRKAVDPILRTANQQLRSDLI